MIHSTDQIFISLTKDVLDVNASFNFINIEDCGGNSLFVGTTRGYEIIDEERISISGLYYEAYETMALKKMIQIVNEIMKKNNEIKRCYVVHRLGMIRAGEASIIISTCSKSRMDCSKETINILNKIKEQCPVFKKIIFENLSDGQESIRTTEQSEQKTKPTINSLLDTNWIMKSEAFWLKK